MARIYFHIGYPKAASTTLQYNLFLNHSQINYLSYKAQLKDRNAFQSNPTTHKLYKLIEETDDLVYDPEELKQIYNKHFDPEIDMSKCNVFSSEGVTQGMVDHELCATRIKSILPDAKIIIVIRRQQDLIRSWYEMNYYKPYSKTNLSLNDWVKDKSNLKQTIFLSGLDYHQIISHYRFLFGSENVLVLLFEWLKMEPDYFFDRLSECLNIERDEIQGHLTNKSNNPASIQRLHKIRKRLLPGIQFSKWLPGNVHDTMIKILTKTIKFEKIENSTEYLTTVKRLYGESNRKLSYDLKIDFERLGYLCQ